MQALVPSDRIIDDSITQLVFKKNENVLSYTLTNVGEVPFQYTENVVLNPGDSKTIGGEHLIPFVFSKSVKFSEGTGLKRVLVETVNLINN